MANKRYSCIGLFNPKSPENVGSIMRAAGCYGVSSVFYTGTRYDRAKDFITDTKKVHQDIPLINIDDLRKILPLEAKAEESDDKKPGRYFTQVEDVVVLSLPAKVLRPGRCRT